jgi:hypothetical protein
MLDPEMERLEFRSLGLQRRGFDFYLCSSDFISNNIVKISRKQIMTNVNNTIND